MRFNTYKITLEELGEPDRYIVVNDPGILPWGYMKKLSKNPDPEIVDDFLKRLVVSWNLSDEAGNVLPIPRDKPEVLDDLPSGVLVYLIQRVNEMTQVSKRGN